MRSLLCLLLLAPTLTFCGCKNFLKFGKKGDASAEADPEKEKDKEKEKADAPTDKEKEAELQFYSVCAELGSQGGTVDGRGSWKFSAQELKRLGATPAAGSAAYNSAISAITDYRKQLEAAGIDLLVAILPPKAVLFADEVSKNVKASSKKRIDGYYAAAAKALDDHGVEVIDLTEDFLRKRKDVYTEGGSELTPEAVRWTAEQIFRKLSLSKGNAGAIEKSAKLPVEGDLDGKTEKLEFRQIFRGDGETAVPLGEGGSALLLLCDANGKSWRKENASLGEQLTFELQRPIDVLAGANARNEQRLKIMSRGTTARNPLSATKVVVWCFSSLDLGSGDWRRVPLNLDFKESLPGLRTD